MLQSGVTPEDARLFRAVGELIENDADLLANGVSAETLRVLFASSGADRAEAVRAIKAGLPVGEAKMKHLESHRKWIEKGAAQAALDARLAGLESWRPTTCMPCFVTSQARRTNCALPPRDLSIISDPVLRKKDLRWKRTGQDTSRPTRSSLQRPPPF